MSKYVHNAANSFSLFNHSWMQKSELEMELDALNRNSIKDLANLHAMTSVLLINYKGIMI